ncbi:hypothetical protein B296_00052976 [Ensete ventricosum]|uniref:Uncharacterized protein n=1 Tax=Ensete ventricosum TaxID=4639 RepID=A0A426XXB8_ENSVE|nr:hypothetical protein B296_00052976 [Ensete ventricosum]
MAWGKAEIRSSMDQSCTTPPKLSLSSVPGQRMKPLGTATPPPRVLVSVPFMWEEVPGKPRKQQTTGGHGMMPGVVRSLDLPPRMVAAMIELKSNKTLSPTTVLDGPEHASRHVPLGSCYSFSFGEGRTVVTVGGKKKGVVRFWGRKSGRKTMRDGTWEMSVEGLEEKDVTCSSMSSSPSRKKHGGEHEEDGNVEGRIRITRLRRNKSLAIVSTSHLWVSLQSVVTVPCKHLWRPEAGGAAAMAKGPQSLSSQERPTTCNTIRGRKPAGGGGHLRPWYPCLMAMPRSNRIRRNTICVTHVAF